MATNPYQCSDQTWGFLAANVPDPPSCIIDCRRRFLEGLGTLPSDETFVGVCELLQDTRGDTSPLWDFYCCDSQSCGVDNLASRGEDPNVNWIINTCSNIGYSSILDPGPPPKTFSCSRKTVLEDDTDCESSDNTSLSIASLANIGTISLMTATAASSTSMATATYSSLLDPSLDVNPHSSSSSGDNGDGISTGIKATIALSTLAFIAVVAVAILLCVRWRSKHPYRSNLREYIKHPPLTPPQAESPTPLMSPSTSFDGTPLMPPPPLKERRLHPVGSRPSSKASTASSKFHSTADFPENSVYSPIRGTITSRHEGSGKTGTSPPSTPWGWLQHRGNEGSVKSISSLPTSASTFSGHHTIILPPRPRRGTYVEIPSPGPPPTRVLPSTPPNGSSSPRRHRDIGVAVGVVSHNPAGGVALEPESQDLCELTEQCSHDSFDDTWVWGPGGGAPGVGSISPGKKRKTDVQSPAMLNEGDLAELGGRY